MTDKKTSFLPKIELLILGVFLICFVMYATSKCSATKARYAEETTSDGGMQDSTVLEPAAANTAQDTVSASAPAVREVEKERFTPLYVTIAGLNVRSEPNLTARVIDRLALYEQVTFLNEVTDSTQEIALGKIVRNDPWVKIRTGKGRTGWVFGAGVHYYKVKLDGVE